MDYRNTTMTPNSLYELLTTLSEKELKLLLIIIRQTAGWIDPLTKKRKERASISHSYFMTATGLVSKSVSNGIGLLLQKQLIAIETKSGTAIRTAKERQWRCRKFYRCLLFETKKAVKFTSQQGKNLRTIKLTDSKLSESPSKKIKQGTGKLSDIERYYQIIGRSVK